MSNELRLVAADGELLPAGEPDVEARTILDLLATASGISATFHALNNIHLILVDAAIQSRFHDKAAANLNALQKQGLEWITRVWPGAAAVPQAFVNAGNRTETYAPRIDAALAAGDAGQAAHLLDGFSGDLANIRKDLVGYRDLSGLVGVGLLLPVGALTLGEASVPAVIAAEAAQTVQLIEDIKTIQKRIEDRARKIAGDTALHLAKLDAVLFAIKHTEMPKPVMEWAKSMVVMIFIGTLPDLEREAFENDIGEMYTKGSQIRQLSVDIFALVNLGGVLLSLAGRLGGHDVQKVLTLFDAQKQRADALAAQLRAKPDPQSVRRAFAAEAQRASLLSEHCKRFQHAALEAPREPSMLWFAPKESPTDEREDSQ